MNIKQVSAFQCDDGSLHLTFAGATTHNFRSQLAKELASNVMLDQDKALRLADVAIKVYERYGVNIARTVCTVNDEILDLLRSTNKIAAIKRYRELTGVGLKDAKDAVELMGLHAGILVKRIDRMTGAETCRYPHEQF